MKSMSKKQPTRGQTLAKAIIGEYNRFVKIQKGMGEYMK
jgi:hypothetical protein